MPLTFMCTCTYRTITCERNEVEIHPFGRTLDIKHTVFVSPTQSIVIPPSKEEDAVSDESVTFLA